MKVLISFFCAAFMLLVSIAAKAQPSQPVPPIPLPVLQERDVAYQMRVERIIDSREKQNLAMNWPRASLINTVYSAALNNDTGPLRPYKTATLDSSYSYSEVASRGEYCHIIQVPDPDFPDDLDMVKDSMICEPLDLSKVVKWKVIEDWIFDDKHSVMTQRIVAIAPLFKPVVAGGLELAETPLFYLKYDDIRPTLTNTEMYNHNNVAASISYDHFFQARLFSSYITKYSNPFDMNISEMEEFADNPMMALLESEHMKQRLFEMEHDQWEY